MGDPQRRLDPRTKLALGLAAIGAVLIARRAETLLGMTACLVPAVLLLKMAGPWIRSLPLMGPMVGVVFAIAALSFDIRVALWLSIRLVDLLTVSLIFFRCLDPEEMGDALRKLGIPYEFSFILTTAMRYVPLIGQKIRHILDAQRSRGIDLRPRLRNLTNFMALLMPLLAQSLLFSEELALAMESRGFGRKGRSFRRRYHLAVWEYGLVAVSLVSLGAFAWWEIG